MKTHKIWRYTVAAAAAGAMQVGAETGTMRPLSTDRPDTTESPYTVDKGLYQIEVEIASMTEDGGRKSYGLGETNLKFGIGESTDIQFVLPLYNHIAGGAEGFGDMQIRVKRNLWGNDGGDTALAVMPYIQLPTGADGIGDEETQGGVIIPFAFEGSDGWSYGVQAQFDLVADPTGSGHNFSFLTSATAARALTGRLGAFFEIVAIFGEGTAATSEQYFNSGLTWAVSETLQLDGGVRTGLSSDAEDFSPFLGISAKF
jgi:hypothetical protein